MHLHRYQLCNLNALDIDLPLLHWMAQFVLGNLKWEGEAAFNPQNLLFCFRQHAADVAFVGASGSILAATGFSSNGVNMVVWDTLAPTTISHASSVCREGGARSLAMF